MTTEQTKTEQCTRPFEVRSDALLGVSFSSKINGEAFLKFEASNGRSAAINMHALADRSGPITKSAIRCWIKDNTPNRENDMSDNDKAKIKECGK
jgi:hypothetical protein